MTSPWVDLLEEYKDMFGGLGWLPGEYNIGTDDTRSAEDTSTETCTRCVGSKDQTWWTGGTQGHRACDWTKWVGIQYAGGSETEQDTNWYRPKGSEPSYKPWALSGGNLEETATRLWKAKEFMVKTCTVLLDKDGSVKRRYKTAFNTSFGRYRWLSMPFGIISAPDVLQETMQEFDEGLYGSDVIVDYFVIPGFGYTDGEAKKSLEENKLLVFAKCRTWNLKLNVD